MGAMKDVETYVEEFVTSYVETLLWTDADSMRDDAFQRGMDPNLVETKADEIHSEGMTEIRNDCEDFVKSNYNLLLAYQEQGRNAEYAAHDFAFSRNGHGTGFWDRGMGDLGDTLHQAAKAYGSQGLGLDDDFKIYVM